MNPNGRLEKKTGEADQIAQTWLVKYGFIATLRDTSSENVTCGNKCWIRPSVEDATEPVTLPETARKTIRH